MQSQAQLKKWINFYIRLRKQYQDSKPVTYEIDLTSTQPKPRGAKFMIMITKFISIFKWGMRETYDNQDQMKENYWTQLNKHFQGQLEMGFVNEGYWEKPKNKIKKYFAILVHTKRIFKVLQEIVQKMGYLYQNQQMKRNNYREEIKNLDFLQDGNYKIMGDIITQFQQYATKKRQQQMAKQIQREQQQKKRLEQLRIQQQKRQKQQQQLLKKQQRQQQQLRLRQELLKKQQAQLQQKRKKQQETARQLINSQYFPQTYQPVFANETPQRIRKDPSTNKLDLPNSPEYEGKIKNSEKLFREKYKDQLQVFAYALKGEKSQEKSICATCGANLKQGIYKLGGNQNFCQYFGKWYCNQHISEERMSIPWKAVEKFDLRGYIVSKAGCSELKAYYQKPIIQIKSDNPIIKQHKNLHDFLVLRRQIHLIYDSICNLQVPHILFKKKQNYFLKQNLFSMKNLYDIYNGQQTIKLQKDYEILSKHFMRCDICQRKKGYHCGKCKSQVKIFPFEIKDTIGCVKCRKLYHRKCLNGGKCRCGDDD